jgi:putative salt-induced outer membrane protein
MHAMKRLALATSLLAFLVTGSRTVLAQTSPPTSPSPVAEGLSTQASASKGVTNVVAKDTFAKAKTPEELEKEKKDTVQASVQAGGLFATGNARSLAVTVAGDFRIRREEHQFSAATSANYGRAGKQNTPVDTTVENVQGLVRYDYFFPEIWGLFLQTSLRHDRFQGLDLRTNIDPGVSAYVMDDKKHRLWFELGYDFQYDARRKENVDQVRLTNPGFERTQTRHNARLFFGYDNQLNSAITFTTGVEYLQPFDPTHAWRMTWNNALKSSITDVFSAATTFTLRYDHNPLPGVEELDALTAVNLIYTIK